YPIEQYLRDTKIDTLYEGTTGIQGQDFFFRKISRDRGEAFGLLLKEMDGVPELETAVAEVRAMADTMLAWFEASTDQPTEIYKVGQNTTRLLMSVGDLLIAWLLVRQARIRKGKAPVAKFFCDTVLPELTARRQVLERTDNSLMEV